MTTASAASRISSEPDFDTHYDLIVIGSGSGNSLATPELDEWRIAIVEQGVFGGTCLNVGCIPTKMYVYPADRAADADAWSRLGLSGPAPVPDWPAIRDRIFGRIDTIAAGGRHYRKVGTPNVTLHEAHAEFVGPRQLGLSTGETLTAEHVVIATGSRAHIPDEVLASGVPYETSDTVMRIDRLPERLIVLGGGYIAAEFAHVFSSFGVHVTVLARTGLLRRHDRDIARRFTDTVRERFHLHEGAKLARITGSPGDIHVELEDGTTADGDLLLVATGRVPNGDRLGLAAGGVDSHPDGRVIVDEYQRTSAQNVWAIGDAANDWQLKHVANHETRVLAHNLAHPSALRAADHRFVPSAVFTHPQIASVGLTEQQAQAIGRRYVAAVQEYSTVAFGWAMEDTVGLCKVLADPVSGQLIGAHLLGEQAATLIQPLIQAMSFGVPAVDVARGQYWIHPALTEVVENALLQLEPG